MNHQVMLDGHKEWTQDGRWKFGWVFTTTAVPSRDAYKNAFAEIVRNRGTGAHDNKYKNMYFGCDKQYTGITRMGKNGGCSYEMDIHGRF